MFLMFNLNCTDSHTSTSTGFITNGYFTMLRKHTLCTVILLCSSSLYANIPIESRGLSSNDTYNNTATAVAINVPNAQTEVVPTNLNWQLTQKTQQLENDIRLLRGKLEEQDNEISQLKNELNNRYTDLDQRLELLLQKIESDNTDTDTTPEEDNQKDITPSTNSNQNPNS